MIDSIVKFVVGKVRLIGNTDGTLIGNTGTRLHVETYDPQSSYQLNKLQNGGSESLLVNGSVTPVNFDWTPGASETWYLEAMSIFLADSGTTSPTNFGALSTLANGLELHAKVAGTDYTVANIRTNMDLLLTFNTDGIIPPTSGFIEMSDAYTGTLTFNKPMKLTGSTSDFVRARVRDNLTGLDQLRVIAKVWRVV